MHSGDEGEVEANLFKCSNRYVLFPIRHKDVWDMYKKAEASFWTAEEVDLSDDKWCDLTPDEQHFIKMTLAFFAVLISTIESPTNKA